MNIGFDAKRAFHNSTGLGQYSRTLIRGLAEHYPGHHYFLFNPKKSRRFHFNGENITEVLPSTIHGRMIHAAWRSSWIKKDIRRMNLDLYHGLSHELPIGIRKTGIKTVVTIHDLIPERFPEQYKPIDVKIYRKKFRYACETADHIIAISKQTRQDIIDFYSINPEKISVCYQSCAEEFNRVATEEEKRSIREKYGLPEKFFLSVGSIIERKNLLNVCKAFFLLRHEVDCPLVVIGNGRGHKQKVKDFALQQNLEKKIILLSEDPRAGKEPGFLSTPDLAIIYQLATAMIYPSFFEGFGVPVLEALCSRLPVITSNVSCLPEAGGPGSLYVDPLSAEEMADAIRRIYSDQTLADQMIQKGLEHARHFAPAVTAACVMNVYEKLLP